MLPEILKDDLIRHLSEIRSIYDKDRREKIKGIWLPMAPSPFPSPLPLPTYLRPPKRGLRVGGSGYAQAGDRGEGGVRDQVSLCFES